MQVDPRMSAAVLGGGLIFFGLTMFFRYSYTALVCILFLVHLLISVSPDPARPPCTPSCLALTPWNFAQRQSIYSVVQQWNGKSVRSFTHDFKIDKDEVRACDSRDSRSGEAAGER